MTDTIRLGAGWIASWNRRVHPRFPDPSRVRPLNADAARLIEEANALDAERRAAWVEVRRLDTEATYAEHGGDREAAIAAVSAGKPIPRPKAPDLQRQLEAARREAAARDDLLFRRRLPETAFALVRLAPAMLPAAERRAKGALARALPVVDDLERKLGDLFAEVAVARWVAGLEDRPALDDVRLPSGVAAALATLKAEVARAADTERERRRMREKYLAEADAEQKTAAGVAE
jgi:hypothetical protein